MHSDAVTKWDLRIKIIGLITLILSGGWTLYKFREDRRVDLEHERQASLREETNKKRELNSFIFQRQAALYFEASNVAAVMATSKVLPDVEKPELDL